ncbi:DUF3040 domain-containing protein [Rhodococcus sp. IEGM 1330]|uniref:DUF3040 domain-containing protein n=1 Tax=Rhodococcus sp. IEGM 1330 TaxID=3082225 RepID=UPI0029530B2B|nr:DUF3040 domain-containing protein [Rhodococcus sp. IEGM 1330]MDV8024070.1 DUF3040 domain-containing protein [Rhodococcus sp. IEGM 1330]
MPLSEHEQRMLDQIESALYAEDPKFASHVRGGRVRAASSRRRFQAAALFVVGLVLLVAGVALSTNSLAFLVVSLIGFLFMFGAGALFLFGGSNKGAAASQDEGSTANDAAETSGRSTGQKSKGGRKGGSFTSRMEDRFRKRFEQD